MKWILIIAAVLICIVAILYLIGRTLPVRHTASVTVTIPAGTDKVWLRITDLPGFTSWRSTLKKIEVLSDTEWIEVSGGDKIPMKITEQVPGKRLTTVINGKNLPFGGAWVYELEPQGDVTLLTITENGEVYPPIFRFVSKYIMGHRYTLKKYTSDLEQSFR